MWLPYQFIKVTVDRCSSDRTSNCRWLHCNLVKRILSQPPLICGLESSCQFATFSLALRIPKNVLRVESIYHEMKILHLSLTQDHLELYIFAKCYGHLSLYLNLFWYIYKISFMFSATCCNIGILSCCRDAEGLICAYQGCRCCTNTGCWTCFLWNGWGKNRMKSSKTFRGWIIT